MFWVFFFYKVEILHKKKQERKQEFPMLSKVAVCQTTLSESLTIIPVQGF